MAAIQIEIQTGYASPWSGQFEQERVTIGRGPGSDVRLHPTKDTACAREVHATIERSPDSPSGWALTAHHQSGVAILGPGGRTLKRLAPGESHPIDIEVQFELGEGGPRLGATAVGQELPATEARPTGGRAPLPVGRVSGDVIQRANRAPKLIGAVLVLLLLVGGGLGYWIFAVRGQGQVIAQQTSEEIQRRADELQRRTEELRAAIAADTELTEAQLAALRESVTELREQPSDRMAQVLVEASPSVWLTGVLNPETGGFTAGGTAWTVSETQLATNAHVADALETLTRMIEGAAPVALREGRRDQMITLSSEMVVHPGYKRWTEILSRQLQGDAAGRLLQFRFIQPCDVAILVPAEPGTDLGAPLKIASGVDSRSLVGDAVGYVGFPSENIAGLPSQQRVSGRISNQTDFIFQPAELRDNMLLHYSAVTTGGASGSPLFNEEGEVVGLVSAGSVIGLGGYRIPVGINYAQRVDFLTELLEGVAEERQNERHERWSASLRSALIPPSQLLERITRDQTRGAEGATWTDREFELTQSGIEHGHSIAIRVERGYRYAFVAVAEDWTDIRSTLLAGTMILAQETSPNYYSVITANPPLFNHDATVTVYTLHDLADKPSKIRFRIVQTPVDPPADQSAGGA